MNPLKRSSAKQKKEPPRKKIIEKGKSQENEVIFKGLEEKSINSLYSSAPIIRLESGDILIHEGDTDKALYIILDGRLRIVRDLQGRPEELAALSSGSWVGEAAFSRKGARTASVVAQKPSSIMKIDRGALNSLDEKAQLYFYKRMNNLSASIISQLEKREEALTAINIELEEYLYKSFREKRSGYHESNMIRSIIKKIPRLPAFVNTLSIKLQEEEASTREVAELIQKDPSLAADVLKTVNSPYYGFEKRVSDINSAVLYLGFKELYQMVVAEGIKRTMPATPGFQELHAHSMAISHIAFALSHKSGVSTPVRMSTIGLVHDLGKSVVALLKKKNPGVSILMDAIDTSRVGALLLEEWNLPDTIWKTVEYQFFPEISHADRIPEEITESVAILYLSHLCYEHIKNQKEQAPVSPFLAGYKKIVKWEALSLDEIVEEQLLPELRKKVRAFPAFFRDVIKKQ